MLSLVCTHTSRSLIWMMKAARPVWSAPRFMKAQEMSEKVAVQRSHFQVSCVSCLTTIRWSSSFTTWSTSR